MHCDRRAIDEHANESQALVRMLAGNHRRACEFGGKVVHGQLSGGGFATFAANGIEHAVKRYVVVMIAMRDKSPHHAFVHFHVDEVATRRDETYQLPQRLFLILGVSNDRSHTDEIKRSGLKHANRPVERLDAHGLGDVTHLDGDATAIDTAPIRIRQGRLQKIRLEVSRQKTGLRKPLHEVQAQQAGATPRIEHTAMRAQVEMEPLKETVNAVLVPQKLQKEVIGTTAPVEFGTDHG